MRPEPALTCDTLGCVGAVSGKTVAVTRHPAALRGDCPKADILIVAGARPRQCSKPQLIIDRAAVHRDGTHAVFIDASGAIRVVTVSNARGKRPWTIARETAAKD